MLQGIAGSAVHRVDNCLARTWLLPVLSYICLAARSIARQSSAVKCSICDGLSSQLAGEKGLLLLLALTRLHCAGSTQAAIPAPDGVPGASHVPRGNHASPPARPPHPPPSHAHAPHGPWGPRHALPGRQRPRQGAHAWSRAQAATWHPGRVQRPPGGPCI